MNTKQFEDETPEEITIPVQIIDMVAMESWQFDNDDDADKFCEEKWNDEEWDAIVESLRDTSKPPCILVLRDMRRVIFLKDVNEETLKLMGGEELGLDIDDRTT